MEQKEKRTKHRALGEKERPPLPTLQKPRISCSRRGRKEETERQGMGGATLGRTRWVTSRGPQLRGQVQERERKTLTWLSGWWDHRGLA